MLLDLYPFCVLFLTPEMDPTEREIASDMKCMHICYEDAEIEVLEGSKELKFHPAYDHIGKTCPYYQKAPHQDLPCPTIPLTCADDVGKFPNACSGIMEFNKVRYELVIYAYRHALDDGTSQAVLATRLLSFFHSVPTVCSGVLEVQDESLPLGVGRLPRIDESPAVPPPAAPKVPQLPFGGPKIDEKTPLSEPTAEMGLAGWTNSGEEGCTEDGAAKMQVLASGSRSMV